MKIFLYDMYAMNYPGPKIYQYDILIEYRRYEVPVM